jgi:glycosyltransferase involved in cell wall biosynthesis
MEHFNPAAIKPGLQLKLREELGISPDDVVISYLGSIGGWYLIDEMMRFCRMVADTIPKAKFLFISPHLHEVIEAHARKQGMDSGRLLVKQAQRADIPALLSLSTFSVFFIKPCYSKISSSPTKHGEIMAMGIPVITNARVGDVRQIVETAESGWVVNDFTDSSFRRVAAEMASGIPFDRNRIREEAIKTYSLDRAVETYRRVYEKIGGGPK